MTKTVTIEQIDARMNEITNAVGDSQKQIESLRIEYNQLLGYKQALLDTQPSIKTEEIVLNEAETTKGT